MGFDFEWLAFLVILMQLKLKHLIVYRTLNKIRHLIFEALNFFFFN